MPTRLPALSLLLFLLCLPVQGGPTGGPVGCPEQIWAASSRLRGLMNPPLSWTRLIEERPQDLAHWLEAFEFFEKSDPTWFESLGVTVASGVAGEELVQKLESACECTLPPAVAGVTLLVSSLHRPTEVPAFSSIENFLQSYSAKISFGIFDYLDTDGNVAKWNRLLDSALMASAQVNERDVRKGRHIRSAPKVEIKDFRTNAKYVEFWKCLYAAFAEALDEKIFVTGKDLEADLRDFAYRFKLNRTLKASAQEMVYSFLRQAFGRHYPKTIEPIPGEKILTFLRNRVEDGFLAFYKEEVERQKQNPPAVASATESARPLLSIAPPQQKGHAPGLSRRRRKQQVESGTTVEEISAVEVRARVQFKKPEDLPIHRFASEADRQGFISWLKGDGRQVAVQVLRRLGTVENETLENILHSGQVIPTIRNPNIWRIKTITKARVTLHIKSPGVYWILGWDANAKANDNQMDRLIDRSTDKLSEIDTD